MISIALFPCPFIDNARIVGELASCLVKPVYSDEMVFSRIQAMSGRSPRRVYSRLFVPRKMTHKVVKERNEIVRIARQVLGELMAGEVDYIYFGMFSALLRFESQPVYHALVTAEYDCRVRRAMRVSGRERATACRLVDAEDSRAAAWMDFLLQREPYDTSLYHTVVHYSCQDLMDVVAWIYMHYNEYFERVPTGCENDSRLAQTVRDTLVEQGIAGEVHLQSGGVSIGLAASDQLFATLAPAILDTVTTLKGVTGVKVHRMDQAREAGCISAGSAPIFPNVLFPVSQPFVDKQTR